MSDRVWRAHAGNLISYLEPNDRRKWPGRSTMNGGAIQVNYKCTEENVEAMTSRLADILEAGALTSEAWKVVQAALQVLDDHDGRQGVVVDASSPHMKLIYATRDYVKSLNPPPEPRYYVSQVSDDGKYRVLDRVSVMGLPYPTRVCETPSLTIADLLCELLNDAHRRGVVPK